MYETKTVHQNKCIAFNINIRKNYEEKTTTTNEQSI